MSEAQIQLGKNVEIVENENGQGDGVIRNTVTGAEVKLGDVVDIGGGGFGTNATESIEDIVAALVSSDANLSWSYDDANDTLTVSLANSISASSVEATNTLTDASGTDHSGELADSSDISSIQSSSDVDHDSTTGGTDANAHHQDPTAGTALTDEGTNKFGVADSSITYQQADDNNQAYIFANMTTPRVKLEPGESYELPILTPDGSNIAELPDTVRPEFHQLSALLFDTSDADGYSTDSNLVAEAIDTDGTVGLSFTGLNTAEGGFVLMGNSDASTNRRLNNARIKNTSSSTTFDNAVGIFSISWK